MDTMAIPMSIPSPVSCSFFHGHVIVLLFMKFQGKRCASGKGMKVMVKVAGGEAVESKGCVTDGKLVTAASVSDLPAFLSDLSTALGVSVIF